MGSLIHERLLAKVQRGEKLLSSERAALHEEYAAIAPGVSPTATFIDFWEEPRDTLITSVIRVWTVGWLAIRYSGVQETQGVQCRVLDVGCGCGEICNIMLSQRMAKGSRVHYTGYDMDVRKAEVFRDLYANRGRFVIHDCRTGLPEPDRSYEVIVNTENLEHYERDEGARLLREFYRCLTDGGYLILTTPDDDWGDREVYDRPHHPYEWSHGELTKELEQCGFTILDSFWFHVPVRSVQRWLPDMYPSRMSTEWLRSVLGPGTGERGAVQAFVCQRPFPTKESQHGQARPRRRRD
jgi:SAM-dependent methyltransferase